jgi:iron complex outermembrane receptor protein
MRTPLSLAAALALSAVCASAHAQDTAQVFLRNLKELSVEDLMNIEVTSVSRRPERLLDVASAIQVITRDDIVRAGATSLPEALRLASNLQVAQIDSRQWAITARGFNSSAANKLLVLIDGRTVYTPLFSGVFWDVQDTPLADIDRIEVISGPGATLWGANAVNGVINITTRHANETHGGRVFAGGGSGPDAAAGARYGAGIDSTLHFRVYAHETRRPESELMPSGGDAQDAWRFTQGGARADWQRSPSTGLTLQTDWYSGRIDQPDGNHTTLSGGNVLGRMSRDISATSNATLQVYFDRTHRFAPNAFGETLDTYDVDFQHRFLLGARHDVVWGFGYRRMQDTVTNSAAIAFLPTTLSANLFTGFIQDEIAIVADRLHLGIGTKIEDNHYTDVEVEPSVRLAWRVRPRHTVWSAVSRAVRAPSRIDREFFSPGVPPHVLNGGPNVVSESVVAYELGYRAQATTRLSLSLSTYFNEWDDLRSVHLASVSPLEIVFANEFRGTSAGAELTADYQPTDSWRLRLGYTQLDVQLEPKPGSSDLQLDGAEVFDAKRHFFLGSSMDLTRRISFHADFRYVSAIDVQNVPAYSELDSRIAWQASRAFTLSVAGHNLLHERHAEFGREGARRLIGRRLYGQMEWRF